MIEALAAERAAERGTRGVLIARAKTTTVTVTCAGQHKVARLQDKAEGARVVCGSGISSQVPPAKTDFNKRLLPAAGPAAIPEL